jgi:hypothetical protein
MIHNDLISDYAKTFGKYNPHGLIVLDDIKRYCYYMKTPLCTNDGRTDEFKTAMNLGRQEVINYIISMINKNESLSNEERSIIEKGE